MTASESILVLNSGSSSLKFGLFGPGSADEELLLHGSAEGIGRASGSLRIRDANGAAVLEQEHVLETQPEALKTIASALAGHDYPPLAAVGHRIVHGGPRLREHQRITPEMLDTLSASVHFAPLHIPLALQVVRQAQETFAVPHFACFDTAFHRTLPQVACHLPLPARYFEQGVMRYGFHGLSCESVLRQLGGSVPAKVIVAHLGNGASVTAIHEGRSVDTSMGLTPTGGVPMGTRTGDLDPGVVLYLIRTEGLDVDALEKLLNQECGLAGLSGGESDMQALLSRCDEGDAVAQLAVNAFCTGVRKCIGGYVALLGGVDMLIFTGGIGEHSSTVRNRICEGLEAVGIDSSAGAEKPKVRVLPSEEEVQIARHTRALLRG
jgi:acetate kinase